MSESRNSQQIDLRTLIGHATAVRAEGKLEEVYQLFGKHNVAFIAVLENGRVLGMCSRWQIGMLLGSRYGFSLYSRKPIGDHLLPQALRVSVQSPIASVLEQVASRNDEAFYDDVLLVDEQGSFLGMVFTRTLVQLQHRFLRESIDRLKEKQREINAKNEQMQEELRMAREVQLAMLPQRYPTFPADVPAEASALRFSHRYRPAGEVSGDFFSDGLFEALNEADIEFGEARLAAAVAKRRDQPVQRLLDEVVTEVERFTGSRKFGDDVCVLAMELA